MSESPIKTVFTTENQGERPLTQLQSAHRKAQLIEMACDFVLHGVITKAKYFKLKYLIKSSDEENVKLAEKILLAIGNEKD